MIRSAMIRTGALVALVALAGCEEMPAFLAPPEVEPGVEPAPDAPAEIPEVPQEIAEVVTAPPPPPAANTAASLDTTTDAQKDAAVAAAEEAEAAGGEARLGETIVSLGDPTEPGIWMKTPLVSQAQAGRVETAGGETAVVQLIPLDGPETAGSQMSIAAFSALGLSLTDLPTVTVYAG